MKIIETYHNDLLNGTGLREVLFFSGCTHHCPGCFNQFTWDPDVDQAHEFEEEDYQELLGNLRKPYVSGVTLSGGDPMSVWNKKGVLDLVVRLKKDLPNKTIWLYTGYTLEQIQAEGDEKLEILGYIDVLCDGRFIESKKSPLKPWVGSENQRVIDMKKTLEQGSISIFA
jgi:anaerobic ribonucleoside-triphosphate reductase activating protein|nr:MAG TPA: 4Fe-4S single cluster domain protein [Bacteriophage sp.]